MNRGFTERQVAGCKMQEVRRLETGGFVNPPYANH
jgi:hypothetical protein